MFHKIFTSQKNNYCLLETVLLLSAARDTVFHFGKVFLSDQLFWFHLKFRPNFFGKHALWFCAGISCYRQASQLAEREDAWWSSCAPASPLWLAVVVFLSSAFQELFLKNSGHCQSLVTLTSLLCIAQPGKARSSVCFCYTALPAASPYSFPSTPHFDASPPRFPSRHELLIHMYHCGPRKHFLQPTNSQDVHIGTFRSIIKSLPSQLPLAL